VRGSLAVRFGAVRTGQVKRASFLLGLIVVFWGSILLIDPMAADDRNCGSVVLRKQLAEPRYAERCDAKLDRRRLPGFALSIVGACLVVGIGPRCLLEPD
jgi:hypothetical protein